MVIVTISNENVPFWENITIQIVLINGENLIKIAAKKW